MSHDGKAMEGWKNICGARLNLTSSQRLVVLMGHDRLSIEGWKNACNTWVNLVAKEGGTWVMIGCRRKDGRMFMEHE